MDTKEVESESFGENLHCDDLQVGLVVGVSGLVLGAAWFSPKCLCFQRLTVVVRVLIHGC